MNDQAITAYRIGDVTLSIGMIHKPIFIVEITYIGQRPPNPISCTVIVICWTLPLDMITHTGHLADVITIT